MGPNLTIGPACQLNAVSRKPAPVPPRAEVRLEGPYDAWKVDSKAVGPLPDYLIPIINRLRETVKLCFYSSQSLADVIPGNCQDLKPGGRMTLNNLTQSTVVDMRVFRPGLFDSLLCRQWLNDPLSVDIEPRNGCTITTVPRRGYDKWDQRVGRAIVCNRNAGKPVRFSLGYFVENVAAAGRIIIVEGWYKLDPGMCQAFNITNRLKRARKPDWEKRHTVGQAYSLYIYGEADKDAWAGGRDEPTVCVDNARNFIYRQGEWGQRMNCVAPNKLVTMVHLNDRVDSERTASQLHHYSF
jgi:hypothetical protein